MKFTAKAIAIAAALSAAAIATPAMASTQPAALTGSGNLCVHDKVNKLNFCLNVLGGKKINGRMMRVWERNKQGEPGNDWEAARVGTVSDRSRWPFAPAANELNELFNGLPVVELRYTPDGHPSDYCATGDNWSVQRQLGYVLGDACNVPDSSILEFVDVHGWYVGVDATNTNYGNGIAHPVAMEGGYKSATRVTLERLNFDTANQDWKWLPRFR